MSLPPNSVKAENFWSPHPLHDTLHRFFFYKKRGGGGGGGGGGDTPQLFHGSAHDNRVKLYSYSRNSIAREFYRMSKEWNFIAILKLYSYNRMSTQWKDPPVKPPLPLSSPAAQLPVSPAWDTELVGSDSTPYQYTCCWVSSTILLSFTFTSLASLTLTISNLIGLPPYSPSTSTFILCSLDSSSSVLGLSRRALCRHCLTSSTRPGWRKPISPFSISTYSPRRSSSLRARMSLTSLGLQ